MSPGRVHQLGQYVSGEVHNAVGQFVLGTKCLLTVLFQPLVMIKSAFSHKLPDVMIQQKEMPECPHRANSFDMSKFICSGNQHESQSNSIQRFRSLREVIVKQMRKTMSQACSVQAATEKAAVR